MPNILNIYIENPDELLNASAYGAGSVVQIQDDAAEAFTTPSDTGTVAIVAGVRTTTFYHPTGLSSTWYRTRYKDSGGTTTSDWSAPFQASEEGGQLCTVYDVKQRLGIPAANTDSDEDIAEFIRQVTDAILDFTERDLIRRPLAGTGTFLFDVERTGRTFWLPGGINTLGSVEVATASQPESGGTYTTVPAADVFMRPTASERRAGWPATRIEISNQSGSFFYMGYNTLRLTDSALGWSAVPARVNGVAVSAVVRKFITKEAGASDLAIPVGPDGAMRVLAGMSPSERAILERMSVVPVG